MVLISTIFRNLFKVTLNIFLLSITLHVSGQSTNSSLDGARQLHIRAEHYSMRGDYIKADMLFNESLAIRKTLADTLSAEYAETLHAWGELKFYQEDQTKAHQLLREASSIQKKTLGTSHPDYIKTTLFQAMSIIHSGDIETGEKQLNESYRLLSQAKGDTLWLHSKFMYYMGELQFYKRDLVSSNDYFTRALEHERKHFGENTIDFARCLSCVSLLRMQLSQPDGVEDLLLKALSIYRHNGLEDHPDNLALHTNLGAFYIMTSQYDQAAQVLPDVLKDIERMLGKEYSYYVNSLNILAISYQHLGFYELAEAAYLESLELRQKMYGEESRQIANILNNIGAFYNDIGNYEVSTRMHRKAQNIAEKHEYQDLYSLIYAGLGQNLSKIGHLEEALDYFNKALDIQEQYAGTDNVLYMTILKEMMNVKGEIIREESDEEILIFILNWTEKRLGRVNIEYMSALNNLALFHYDFGHNEKAVNCFNQVLEVLFQLKNYKNDLLKQNLLHNTAQCYEKMNNPQRAIAYCSEAVQAVKNETKNTFAFLSEKEREAFIQSRMKHIQQCKNMLMRCKDEGQDVVERLYNNELFYKNLLLSSSIQIQRSIQEGNNNDLIMQWNELRTLKDRLSRINREKVANTYIDSIENRCNQLEKHLVRESTAYREEQSFYDLTWQDIKSRLGKHRFMVDYVWTFDCLTSEVLYNAIILGADFEKPIIVSCCKESDLKAAVDVGDMDAIYHLIWEPVAEILGPNVHEVFVVPTRLLYQISFNGLKDRHGVYLVDKHLVRNMLSARSLVRLTDQKQEEHSVKSIVLFGGADYDLSLTDYLNLHSTDDELKRGQGFHYLPGSRTEVHTIGNMLSDSRWKVTVLTDTEATEARLKSYSGISPNVLHISTHGFYFADSPLLRTGLVFTGANAAWNNGVEILTSEVEDGILSAYEVANLDLSNTQLVVLSACNTAKGDFRVGSEGLYGLQRAFHLAGVQSLIVSLWEISDTDTVTFMSKFYQEWNNGNTPTEAFILAQKSMKDLFPGDTNKWSAFVFIE